MSKVQGPAITSSAPDWLASLRALRDQFKDIADTGTDVWIGTIQGDAYQVAVVHAGMVESLQDQAYPGVLDIASHSMSVNYGFCGIERVRNPRKRSWIRQPVPLTLEINCVGFPQILRRLVDLATQAGTCMLGHEGEISVFAIDCLGSQTPSLTWLHLVMSVALERRPGSSLRAWRPSDDRYYPPAFPRWYRNKLKHYKPKGVITAEMNMGACAASVVLIDHLVAATAPERLAGAATATGDASGVNGPTLVQLATQTGWGESTLRRYADKAGVKRPDRGHRGKPISWTDISRIAEAHIAANPNARKTWDDYLAKFGPNKSEK